MKVALASVKSGLVLASDPAGYARTLSLYNESIETITEGGSDLRWYNTEYILGYNVLLSVLRSISIGSHCKKYQLTVFGSVGSTPNPSLSNGFSVNVILSGFLVSGPHIYLYMCAISKTHDMT